ncbi:MAG: hypothetical protein V2I33_26515 [Kangiellaceae bacterium]|nr:hypothetical protein [Kangiellaceae bacterium]
MEGRIRSKRRRPDDEEDEYTPEDDRASNSRSSYRYRESASKQ